MTTSKPSTVFLPLLLILSLTLTLATSEVSRQTVPRKCRPARARQFEGCRCYLKYLDILFYSGPRDGKAFAFGVFCPKVPGEFPDELELYCDRYVKNGKLKIVRALRSIDRYLRICLGERIKDDLPEDSQYCKFFE